MRKAIEGVDYVIPWRDKIIQFFGYIIYGEYHNPGSNCYICSKEELELKEKEYAAIRGIKDTRTLPH